ncbi:basic secretory protein [Dillenia turbinata]|uniref:Basic secretory protein n=1 Tax=Dillenia turbinata TaxID=194707 RepID=A0AAN8YXD2_9MAGN
MQPHGPAMWPSNMRSPTRRKRCLMESDLITKKGLSSISFGVSYDKTLSRIEKCVRNISLFIDSSVGVAYYTKVGTNEIHVNANHIGNYTVNVLYHEMTLVYGHAPQGLIEEYDFVAELNAKLRDDYSNDCFVDLIGETIDQLWTYYKTMYGH